jgi:hydroxymethylbilane synthase
MLLLAEKCIAVGARSSGLSQAQCREVLYELRRDHPDVEFDIQPTLTTGDKDLQTSLRFLGKTDFFTKEIDAMLFNRECRIAIHSAKDLPEPLPEGLKVVALTKGLDPSDTLVMREGVTFETLESGSVIATSSERREEIVRKLRSDLKFCDIRGTIEQRLQKLFDGEVDGVVVAEAALLRLGLDHLKRYKLPGATAQFQGQLAVLAREDDEEMEALFSCIDTRTRCLYMGIDLPSPPIDTKYTHYPLIRPLPRDPNTPDIEAALNELESYTHIIFTSKSSVRIFFAFLQEECIDNHCFICVGTQTAREVVKHGGKQTLIAKKEMAEGIVDLLKTLNLSDAKVLWPHSSLSRPVISHYLVKHDIPHKSLVIYDTVAVRPQLPPDLSLYDALFFTSPSTVDAYLKFFGNLPSDKEIRSTGPITREAIELSKVIRHT